MRNCLCILFLCLGHLGFSQSLEDKIYTATEAFIAKQNNKTFQTLIEQEIDFQKNAQSKDEFLSLVFLKNNKAYFLKETNKLPQAITNYENAWELYTKHKLAKITDYDIIEFCLKPLGNLYTKTNNYTNAENTIKEYISIAEKQQNNEQYVAGIINLAVLYRTLNKYESVIQLTENTLANEKLTSKQRQNLKDLSLQSKIALGKLEKADDLGEKNTPNYYQKAYALSIKNNELDKAISYFKKYEDAIAQQEITQRELAKFYVKKAHLYFRMSDAEHPSENLSTAKKSLETAIQTLLPTYKQGSIPNTDELFAENTFIDIFELIAEITIDPDEALAYYDLAFYVSNLIQGQLTSQEAKMRNLAGDRKRSEFCLELLSDAHQKTPTNEIFEKALKYAEIGKAEVLSSNFEKKSLLAKHPKDTLLLLEKELLQKQEQLTHLMVNSIKKNDSLSKQLLATSVDIKRLQQQISEKYPSEEKEIKLLKIQERLFEDNASLMVFFYGKRSLYQFIISPQETRFLQKHRTSQNDGYVSDFIHCFDDASVINNDVNSFKNRSNSLYRFLDMNMAISTKNIILIPDGKLNFVPFDALLRDLPETNSFSKMPFVVNEQQLSYNASIKLYLKKSTPSKSKNILGLAPVFENTKQPLTFSLSEVENLKKRTNAKILLKEEATKVNFLKIASNYDILHLSTHASAPSYTPATSIYFYDGPLLLNELYSLDLNPNLVVLSACETGVGALHKGEGALSIARGFNYAGAKNVLFSLWQVNDKSTATLMDLFYKSYTKNESVATANWQAKQDYLNDENISNAKKSPYYWSAFIYSGDLEAKSPSNWIYFYGLGLLLLLVVLLLWIVKRK